VKGERFNDESMKIEDRGRKARQEQTLWMSGGKLKASNRQGQKPERERERMGCEWMADDSGFSTIMPRPRPQSDHLLCQFLGTDDIFAARCLPFRVVRCGKRLWLLPYLHLLCSPLLSSCQALDFQQHYSLHPFFTPIEPNTK